MGRRLQHGVSRCLAASLLLRGCLGGKDGGNEVVVLLQDVKEGFEGFLSVLFSKKKNILQFCGTLSEDG